MRAVLDALLAFLVFITVVQHFDNRFSHLTRKIDMLLERTKPPLPTMEQIVAEAKEAAARAAAERAATSRQENQ